MSSKPLWLLKIFLANKLARYICSCTKSSTMAKYKSICYQIQNTVSKWEFLFRKTPFLIKVKHEFIFRENWLLIKIRWRSARDIIYFALECKKSHSHRSEDRLTSKQFVLPENWWTISRKSRRVSQVKWCSNNVSIT